MKKVLSLRTVLASIVVVGTGAGSALAQTAPSEPTLTPPPGQPCPGEDPNCPAPEATQQPQQTYTPAPQPTETREEEAERFGFGLTVGGGVTDYIDQQMRNVTGIGGTWEVRAYVGLNQPIGLEVAYVGSARSLDSVFGPALDADLIGNGAEAAARINIFHQLPVQPYGIIGIGWTHWSTSGDDFTLADAGVEDKSDVLVVPLGAGAAWRNPLGMGGWLVDARFTFRASLGDDLVVSEPVIINDVPIVAGEFVDTDSWEVSARLGYEFF